MLSSTVKMRVYKTTKLSALEQYLGDLVYLWVYEGSFAYVQSYKRHWKLPRRMLLRHMISFLP